MKTQLALLLLAAAMAGGCGQVSDSTSNSTAPSNSTAAAPTPATNAPSGGSLATAPVDYLQSITRQEQAAMKSADFSKLNEDTQLFNAQEGRYPKDLNELVEKKYIGRLPDLPPGLKFAYDAEKGNVTIVSQ